MIPVFKKWSLLGLLLMAASAVVAAILPQREKDPEFINGSMTFSSGWADGQMSCQPVSYIDEWPCHYTIESGSTAGMLTSIQDDEPHTDQNTTHLEQLDW